MGMDFFEEELLMDGLGRRRTSRYGYDGYSQGPSLGIDPLNGDLVEELPGGLGIDLDNGDLTVDVGPFGFDL
jgi:hypothetical protein